MWFFSEGRGERIHNHLTCFAVRRVEKSVQIVMWCSRFTRLRWMNISTLIYVADVASLLQSGDDLFSLRGAGLDNHRTLCWHESCCWMWRPDVYLRLLPGGVFSTTISTAAERSRLVAEETSTLGERAVQNSWFLHRLLTSKPNITVLLLRWAFLLNVAVCPCQRIWMGDLKEQYCKSVGEAMGREVVLQLFPAMKSLKWYLRNNPEDSQGFLTLTDPTHLRCRFGFKGKRQWNFCLLQIVHTCFFWCLFVLPLQPLNLWEWFSQHVRTEKTHECRTAFSALWADWSESFSRDLCLWLRVYHFFALT